MEQFDVKSVVEEVRFKLRIAPRIIGHLRSVPGILAPDTFTMNLNYVVTRNELKKQ